MSLPWYQYAIVQMDAVTAAADALNKYLGQYFLVRYCLELMFV